VSSVSETKLKRQFLVCYEEKREEKGSRATREKILMTCPGAVVWPCIQVMGVVLEGAVKYLTWEIRSVCRRRKVFARERKVEAVCRRPLVRHEAMLFPSASTKVQGSRGKRKRAVRRRNESETPAHAR
jgi:hypothetical protein